MADFPDTVWDGLLLSTIGLSTKQHNDIIEPHLLHSLALDLTETRDELVSVQDYLYQKWRNKFVDLHGIGLGTLHAPDWHELEEGQVLGFSDQAVEGNEERVHFNFKLPRSYKNGSTVYVNLTWLGEDDTEGDVRWKLTYSWANLGESFPTNDAKTIDVANTGLLTRSNFGGITGTGKEALSVILLSLRRNSSHDNDTYSAKDAYLVTLDILYQFDKLGDDEP